MMEGVGKVKDNMEDLKKKMEDMISEGLDKARIEMENTAKMQAPWHDRTGNARNSITGSGVEKEKDNLKVGLAIGVDYGKWLELCNGGRYRIVWPTIEWEGNKLFGYFKL